MTEKAKDQIGLGSVLSTISAPSVPLPAKAAADNATPAALLEKVRESSALSAQTTDNPGKPHEVGEAARCPFTGASHAAKSPLPGSSTVSESNGSDKVGSGKPPQGANHAGGDLDRVRADSTGQVLTTNQGVAIADNQNSLKIGLRGPTALEDFILREKITHFDHERIPERIVHARGSAAHGYFENYQAIPQHTKAAPFAEAGKRTPVFVRFSTVAGERGSTDTARDVRGFAVKFYSDAGNWDLVGNNIPIFFIQDAMKFPDLIHAVKPEPHNGIPQAASAHDTFWDFASLMPEMTHMLLWAMSDRAIPRSYRTMQGFGVHTFRLINEQNEAVFCKFHWNPLAGTHSLAWDEAVKISGADSDFHRRDLWEAIEAGAYPEWELNLQIFTEEQANEFAFDVLDPTKLIPVELVPLLPVGKLVLNRNPDNFFAETEQVAFCAAHVIPGIDFSNDPLLQGRIHSYVDTQISRLGGANFHELPINTPLRAVHNNQRDGMHRQTIPRGRVAYEPNSLGGGCPFQAGAAGFTSFPEPVAEDKVRGKPEKFADHYSQAKLFWHSQTPVEQQHIINAFRFELTRVQTQAIRERVVSLLVHVDGKLAQGVAHGLGFEVPAAAPLASDISFPELPPSPALSLSFYPGDGSIKTRKVAILVADGVDTDGVHALYNAVLAGGGVPRVISHRLGKVNNLKDAPIVVEGTLEAMPSVLFDAVVIPSGPKSATTLGNNALALDFLREQYRHCKPILVVGDGKALLQKAGIATQLASGKADPALLVVPAMEKGIEPFIKLLGQPRDHSRESDPPQV
ncbi:catalase [Andreprevotia sp. IGB-42]|uniref:catalase n=1 Tax=Andreprevotia sp. IGB-42 TaxID=2497473 RepID=UPI0013588B7D|nr:catalase [Andreprevotia sp. IGB-42]